MSRTALYNNKKKKSSKHWEYDFFLWLSANWYYSVWLIDSFFMDPLNSCLHMGTASQKGATIWEFFRKICGIPQRVIWDPRECQSEVQSEDIYTSPDLLVSNCLQSLKWHPFLPLYTACLHMIQLRKSRLSSEKEAEVCVHDTKESSPDSFPGLVSWY